MIRSATYRSMAAWVAVLALTACSGAEVLNATIPRDGYHVTRDIHYAPNDRATLDVYVPEGVSHAPVILFFYGGSWQSGSKDDYLFLGQAFASRGYITVVADYRLYPQVYFPDFVVDAGHALKWTHDHIAEYGGDTNRLFVAGHSAGAFNAAMLTLNEDYLTQAAAKRSWIRGVIGIAGPYDFLPLTDPDIIALFSKKPAAETQPINFVHGTLPPFFLATGKDDDTVLARNSRNLTAALKANHTPVTLREYNEVEHIGIILSLARGFRDRAPLLADIVAFIDHTP